MSPAAGPPLGRVLFIVLMLGLMVVFAALGTWQMQRLAEKEALIATVASSLDAPPAPLPPSTDWTELTGDELNFRPVTATGTFQPAQRVLVFTSLADARGEAGGPGYWVMTPVALEGGGTLFANRGFIPQAVADDLDALEPPPAGAVDISGLARRGETASPFTPAPDAERGIDWIRDPARLAEIAGIGGPVAPLYLDLPAGAPGELPQGGETVVEFPNNHLGYAMTWFSFAILTPILLVFWLRRQGTRTGA